MILSIYKRYLHEGISTGLSRPPITKKNVGLVLADFATVMRGVATGSNEFFFLTKKQATSLNIPNEFLLPAIGRTRDVRGNEINNKVLQELENKRPTLLLSLDGRSLEKFPQSVRQYLKYGESLGIHKKTLIATRNPWYKMEVRPIPPILFAYLGRRNTRFIRNNAGVIPLTGFLCVYPHKKNTLSIDKLWKILNHPKTLMNLELVGKSYGDGSIKVEPRALERLSIPMSVFSKEDSQFLSKTN